VAQPNREGDLLVGRLLKKTAVTLDFIAFLAKDRGSACDINDEWLLANIESLTKSCRMYVAAIREYTEA
jgi:hypothetical protein